KVFVGSELDVLNRFCSFLRFIELNDIYKFPDYIIRATADNPFLFVDAANEMCQKYENLSGTQKIDYFTWTGLPHGSGVEILNVKSLLESETFTSDPYDHEHVGPALYNHKDRYNCVFEPSPKKYNHPELRTTIDTFADYFKAQKVVSLAQKSNIELTTKNIIELESSDKVNYPILFVPAVQVKTGTGHFRRCLDLAINCDADLYCGKKEIWENAVLEKLTKCELENGKITSDQFIFGDIPENYYKLIVLDDFSSSKSTVDYFSRFAPVVTIDDGACDKILEKTVYNLNIIPSFINEKNINLKRIDFIPVPKKLNQNRFSKDADFSENLSKIKKVFLLFGSTGNEKLSSQILKAFADLKEQNSAYDFTFVNGSSKLEGLVEDFHEYDLVITYYGFSAFEAIAAGSLVFTVSPTKLHRNLSLKYGFADIPSNKIHPDYLMDYFKKLFDLEIYNPSEFLETLRQNAADKVDARKNLSSFFDSLKFQTTYDCPVCRKNSGYLFDPIVSRDKIKTIRRCSKCGIDYISFINAEKRKYNSDYFDSEYKNQYGKTYLEDFESIKASGLKRHAYVAKYVQTPEIQKKVLDVGCAYGPYLSAASETPNWMPYGIDVCESAIEHVNKLGFKGKVASFTDGFTEEGEFDAVTMWYVIEHFENLNVILKNVKAILKKGGVFAFSTPSSTGVSGRKNTASFYENSPSDHYSIWSPKTARIILEKNGFKVKKIVSSGIHPERHPFIKKHNFSQKNFFYKLFAFNFKLFRLGDTFEIYCVKKDR
ncbi:MAG: methyltransferase domain-containing protein, partial [Treponemataceae bacterium]|nr:methyltransferase domain-containing protein [Treponemataceae bacterium]